MRKFGNRYYRKIGKTTDYNAQRFAHAIRSRGINARVIKNAKGSSIFVAPKLRRMPIKKPVLRRFNKENKDDALEKMIAKQLGLTQEELAEKIEIADFNDSFESDDEEWFEEAGMDFDPTKEFSFKALQDRQKRKLEAEEMQKLEEAEEEEKEGWVYEDDDQQTQLDHNTFFEMLNTNPITPQYQDWIQSQPVEY